jgi:uncharacterized protein
MSEAAAGSAIRRGDYVRSRRHGYRGRVTEVHPRGCPYDREWFDLQRPPHDPSLYEEGFWISVLLEKAGAVLIPVPDAEVVPAFPLGNPYEESEFSSAPRAVAAPSRPQPRTTATSKDAATAALPTFRYHPDPVQSGSLVPSDAPCPVCGLDRGLSYVGPVYALDEVEDLCPWCIADGTAAETFDAEFTDVEDAPSAVPAEVLAEIARRTPGFSGWQQEHWLYHCADGAAFLGRVGSSLLTALPTDAQDAVLRAAEEAAGGERSAELLGALDADSTPTAYLFRCLHCQRFDSYIDFI